MNRLIGFFADGLPFDGDTIKSRALGGSESAVYYMAKELRAMGNEVKVICNCDKPGTHEGVQYIHKSDFKYLALTIDFDVFVVSRFHNFFQVPFKSKLKILWNHDMLDNKFVLLKYLPKIDVMFNLSGFHVNDYTTKIPELRSKIWQTRNGIDIETVNRSVKGVKKNPGKMIYASRPERGLKILLEAIWPRLLKKLPHLELHICGYSVDGTDLPAEIRELYVHIDRLIKEKPRVFQLGNLSKPEYYSNLAESQLMLYPCDFPEISCIVALEAQACKTPIITTNDFALKETVGVEEWLIDGLPAQKDYQESFIKKVKELLANPSFYEKTAQKGYEWVRSRYTWRTIAEEWDAFLEKYLQDIGQALPLRKMRHIPNEFRRGSPCGYPVSPPAIAPPASSRSAGRAGRDERAGIAGRPCPYGKMRLFQKNLKALSSKAPYLSRQIEEIAPSKEIQVVMARSGLPVLKNHIALHSLVDPEKEARNWAHRAKISEAVKAHKKIAVFGFGMGYHIKALLDLGCPSVIVIEPDPAVLRVAFEWIDFSAYLEKITLLLGREEISDPQDLHLIPHQPTVRLHKDVYSLWEERIESAQQLRETIADMVGAFRDNEEIIEFLKTFDPDEEADIDKLVERIPRGQALMKDWQVVFFLMKELKERPSGP